MSWLDDNLDDEIHEEFMNRKNNKITYHNNNTNKIMNIEELKEIRILVQGLGAITEQESTRKRVDNAIIWIDKELNKLNQHKITVKLENKVVGHIKVVDKTYQYFPKGSKIGGQIFKNLENLKIFLEEE